MWWISDLGALQADYPGWAPRHGVREILQEIHDRNRDRWTVAAA
jgi:hypothetical protein